MTKSHDELMYDKGYRFKLVPTNGEFEPLYAKTIADVGSLMRSWPNIRFNIISMFIINMPVQDSVLRQHGIIVGTEK